VQTTVHALRSSPPRVPPTRPCGRRTWHARRRTLRPLQTCPYRVQRTARDARTTLPRPQRTPRRIQRAPHARPSGLHAAQSTRRTVRSPWHRDMSGLHDEPSCLHDEPCGPHAAHGRSLADRTTPQLVPTIALLARTTLHGEQSARHGRRCASLRVQGTSLGLRSRRHGARRRSRSVLSSCPRLLNGRPRQRSTHSRVQTSLHGEPCALG
jgi:hypothetical protein